MADLLDVRTLLISMGAAFFCSGLVMFYFHRNRDTRPGFGQWAWGNVLLGAGYTLGGFSSILPDTVTSFMPVTAIVSALILFYLGFTLFAGRKADYRVHVMVILVLALVVFPYFTYYRPSFTARMSIGFLTGAVYLALQAKVLLKDVRAVVGNVNKLILTSVISLALLFAGIGGLSLMADPVAMDAVFMGGQFQLVLMLIVGLFILFIFGLMLLNAQMVEKSLHAEHEKVEMTAAALSRRSLFERMISELSSDFLLLDAENTDHGIEDALARIGAFSKADRAYVFLYQKDSGLADNTHEWCAPGITPQIHNLKDIEVARDLPWFSQRIQQRETVAIPDVAALPEAARIDKAHFLAQNIQSLVVVPMVLKEKLVGFLGFDAVAKKRPWDADDLVTLKMAGQMFTNAIERKRAEIQLRETEQRWQFALEGAGDGVWDWDVATGRVYFSKQWKAMLGYGEYEIGQGLDEWEKRVHPEDMAAVQKDLDRHLLGETPVYLNEHRMLCKDGTYKWILDRGKVIERDQDKKPKRVIGIHTDISRQKAADAERLKLIAELQDALAQVKALNGLLPICSICKKIRDDKGYWNRLEAYIHEHSDARFTHGLCPDCAKKHYPGMMPD